MEHRRRVLLSVAVAVTSVGVAVFVYVRGVSARSDSEREFEQTRVEALRPLASAQCVPLGDASAGLASVAARLRASPEPDGDKRAAAIEAVASFLATRFVGAEAGRTSWAEALARDGATLRHDLAFSATFAAYYQRMTGEALPGDADPVQAFARLAAAEDASASGLSVPIGVALSPELVAVAVGRYSLANPAWPRPTGPIDHAATYSNSMISHASLWRHPEGLQAQLDARGGADVAQVQLIIEFAPGDRRPCLFNLVWAPGRGRWVLDNSSIAAPSLEESTWIKWAY